MKKLIAILLLCGASQAEAASFGYGSAGGSTTNLTTTLALANRGGTTSGLRRTAVVSDRLDSMRVYCDADDGADSVIVGLYYGGASPSQLLFADTIAAPASAGWATTGSLVSEGFEFVDGLNYFVTVGSYDDQDVLIHYTSSFTGDGETNTSSVVNPWINGTTNSNKYSLECFYTALTYSWGGPKLKHPDSIYATYNQDDNSDLYDTLNYGSSTILGFRVGAGGANNRSALIRPTNDQTTSGFVQDSLRIYFSIPSAVASEDSIRFGAYALNAKSWGEGNNAGAPLRADAGECSWDSAKTGSVAWASEAGGTGVADRDPSTVAGYRWYRRSDWVNDSIADIWYSYITIPSSHITGDFDTCGYVIWIDAGSMSSVNFTWNSDDNSTQARRPFMLGWESSSADTCSVDHVLGAVDTELTTIVVQNTYTDNATVMDSMKLVWDDDSNPADPLGTALDATSLASPDTLTAIDLTQCVTYYLWWIAYPDGCTPDTSAAITIPTLCPITRRTVIGAGG